MDFDKKNLYEIKWNALNDKELKKNISKKLPSLLRILQKITLPGNLPIAKKIEEFKNDTFCRPPNSYRAFYWKFESKENVLAIKGTEILSPQLFNVLLSGSYNKIPQRPWTKFENFIYREQKAPLAMLYNEAYEEGMIGANYQKKIFKHFKKFEEAPLPVMIIKWKKDIVESYKKKIGTILSKRAKNLLFTLIDSNGLGGIVYHYPYLPTRVRFNENKDKKFYEKISIKKKLKAIQNMIDITARMLISGFLPFDYEDHGVGQCIAPQNITLRGGICDLGSIKKDINQYKQKDLFALLRATGVLLSRSAYEIVIEDNKDIIYEFSNPTTFMHQISGIIHSKLQNSIVRQKKNLRTFNPLLKTYFSIDDRSLIKSLGMKD